MRLKTFVLKFAIFASSLAGNLFATSTTSHVVQEGRAKLEYMTSEGTLAPSGQALEWEKRIFAGRLNALASLESGIKTISWHESQVNSKMPKSIAVQLKRQRHHLDVYWRAGTELLDRAQSILSLLKAEGEKSITLAELIGLDSKPWKDIDLIEAKDKKAKVEWVCHVDSSGEMKYSIRGLEGGALALPAPEGQLALAPIWSEDETLLVFGTSESLVMVDMAKRESSMVTGWGSPKTPLGLWAGFDPQTNVLRWVRIITNDAITPMYELFESESIGAGSVLLEAEKGYPDFKREDLKILQRGGTGRWHWSKVIG